ncbi:MAG TPA: hypothetical protein VMT11_12925 [Myxococcaceae bacterium]|nr:hypothetical protein [Myxococcaceae bacterium]
MRHTVKSGEVISVAGNKVVVREADGIHEYTVPDGFKFQLDGQDVGIDQLKPGMKVGALITDKTTTRDVTVTRVVSGTVMQVAPGGIVIKDAKGDLKSYNFKDPDGNDVYYAKDGKEVLLRNVKKGERLTGTFVTKLPPQTISQRSVAARAVAPPEPAPAAEVAAATPPHRLPKTASPLPLLGLLALVSAGIALSLRAARALR